MKREENHIPPPFLIGVMWIIEFLCPIVVFLVYSLNISGSEAAEVFVGVSNMSSSLFVVEVLLFCCSSLFVCAGSLNMSSSSVLSVLVVV